MRAIAQRDRELENAISACLAATEAILADVGLPNPYVVITFAWEGKDGTTRVGANNLVEPNTDVERDLLVSVLRAAADDLAEM